MTSQTQTIGQQIVRETMLNERQRIARELHDTLEQGLTALTMQLNRVYRKIKNDPESSLQAVEQAENILRVCRDESRASIQDLRGGLLEEMDLPAAVEKTIISRLDDTTVGFRPELKLSMSGVPVRLTLFAEHQLLRTITEAASNAVQHASPETISIQLDYGEEELHVVVQDDGCGFDPEHADEAGHFGVRGMYERVNRIGGKLEIESSEQSGTRVLVNVPVTDLLKEGQL